MIPEGMRRGRSRTAIEHALCMNPARRPFPTVTGLRSGGRITLLREARPVYDPHVCGHCEARGNDPRYAVAPLSLIRLLWSYISFDICLRISAHSEQ